MADRPSTIPTWATSGSTVDPGAGKRATGWLPSEKPPAQYFNWLQNAQGQWLASFLQESIITQLSAPTLNHPIFPLLQTLINPLSSVSSARIAYYSDVDAWMVATGDTIGGSVDVYHLSLIHI